MQPETHAAFQREARVIAHVHHPHIVQVRDYGIEEQAPYLVMEYLPNGTLRTRHPRGTRLSLEQIVPYVQQIASALDYAHTQQVIHRDVKPENLLLNANGEIVLSDFGIAVVQRTLASLSEQHMAGTPLYMAPEQIQHRPCPASDQYALGVLVYEWLCGEPPFAGTLYEVLSHHLSQAPPSLCARVPLLPPAVEEAVFRALSKDPTHRFPTVQDFATALEDANEATQPLKTLSPGRGSRSIPVRTKEEDHAPPPDPPLNASLPAPSSQIVAPQQPLSLSAQDRDAQRPQQVPLSPVTQRNRHALLRKVHSFWIEGVLEQSLHGAALLALGLEEQPDAIANPWHLIFQQPERTPHPLPVGTRITQVYDTAEGELLILGAPGAGKTTLLLELARDLLARAERDAQHPLPVVFNLSSWAVKQQPLTDWLVEELNSRYHVPSKLGQTWVEADQILPLLDGLDEVAPTARSACIEAVNSYRQEHGLLPLVVCSRQADYLAQSGRLLLRSAVLVQPLTQEQVDASLALGGEPLWALRVALHQDATLRELTNTPLMLSILTLTYHGKPVEELLRDAPIEERQRQIFEQYVRRMLTRRGPLKTGTVQQVVQWLTYLAQQMRVHQQTIFYAEYLQPDWLPISQQRTVIWLATRLPAILLGGCVGLLISFLMGAFSDPASLVQMGLLGGFVGGCLSRRASNETATAGHHPSASRQVNVMNCILLGTLLAVSFGFSLRSPTNTTTVVEPGYALSDWLRDGSIFGIGSGLSAWLFQVFLFRRPRLQDPTSSPHTSSRWRLFTRFATIAPRSVWQATFMFAVAIGLSAGLRAGLSYGLDLGLSQGQETGLSYGLDLGLTTVLLSSILALSLGPLRFAERIHWTWNRLLQSEHLRMSLIITGILFFFYGLSFWPSYGLDLGLSYGLRQGLSYGLSYGLGYWVLLGLYQGMTQEHVEDQDRHHFNQGIRRSMRNGILISLMSASIIAGIRVLSNELNTLLSSLLSPGLISAGREGFWHSQDLRVVLSDGLSNLWITLISGFLLIWALSGGLTILRHYVIRWLLARSHRFPWRAQAFLDDATARILLQRVGGGYRFIHRRLLDYFADLDTTATPASTTPLVPTKTHEA